MRARQASTTSTHETSRLRIAAASSVAERKQSRGSPIGPESTAPGRRLCCVRRPWHEEVGMYARVTWLEGAPAQAREAVAAMREQAIPAIEATPGVQEVLFLMDREGGRALALTFWETLEDLE